MISIDRRRRRFKCVAQDWRYHSGQFGLHHSIRQLFQRHQYVLRRRRISQKILPGQFFKYITSPFYLINSFRRLSERTFRVTTAVLFSSIEYRWALCLSLMAVILSITPMPESTPVSLPISHGLPPPKPTILHQQLVKTFHSYLSIFNRFLASTKPHLKPIWFLTSNQILILQTSLYPDVYIFILLKFNWFLCASFAIYLF